MVLLILGLAGVETTVRNYRDSIQTAARPDDMVMVIVAARDLYPGLVIVEDDLYAVEYPVALTPDSALTNPDQVLGLTASARILTNELVRLERLADPTRGNGLNALVPRGMRALSIDIKDGPALGGLLAPGTYVDVMATIDGSVESGRSEDVTVLLLQAAYVLAVHKRTVMPPMHDDHDNPPLEKWSVTLAVTPSQAEEIVSAEWHGLLWLTLRNDTDVSYVQGSLIRSDDVLEGD